MPVTTFRRLIRLIHDLHPSDISGGSVDRWVSQHNSVFPAPPALSIAPTESTRLHHQQKARLTAIPTTDRDPL